MIKQALFKLTHLVSFPNLGRPFVVVKNTIKTTIVLGFIFALVYIITNGPALWIRYIYQIPIQASERLLLPEIADINSSLLPSILNDIVSQYGNNKLVIKKINVNVPIIWDVKEATILEELKNGVAHYAGTAYPRERGNVFITGHSSNYWWTKGDYNYIFALLDKLEISDEIIITYKDSAYIYKVMGSKVVKPEDVSVLNSTPKSTLTLMTCTPVGTTLNRLIVTASLVIPEKTINKKAYERPLLPLIKTLPKVR